MFKFYLLKNSYLVIIQNIIISEFLSSVYTWSRSQTYVKTCIIVQRVLESTCNKIENKTMLTLK